MDIQFRSYDQLAALPPEAFLDPANFRTIFDGMHEGQALPTAQYEKGLRVGRASRRVGVSVNNTWWAEGRDGSSTTAYEGIGYHACTADLWRGLLDSGAEVWVYRTGTKTGVRIK